MAALSAYDHYAYALTAVFGTAFAVWLIDRIMGDPRGGAWVASLRGVVPPFINIIGVLFGLTLAFLANDTWSAHERTTNAVYREADALRSMAALAATLPEAQKRGVLEAARAYQQAVVGEWPELARRAVSPAATIAGDALLGAVARVEGAAEEVRSQLMRKAMDLRVERDARISLAHAHVNPLKWLGMAFLGLVTLLSVAVVHAENRRAALTAMVLFSLGAAPAAAIVLVQSNPFQPPASVSVEPIAQALAGL